MSVQNKLFVVNRFQKTEKIQAFSTEKNVEKEWGLWGQLWFSGAKQKRKQKNSLSISNKTSLQSTGSKVKKNICQ